LRTAAWTAVFERLIRGLCLAGLGDGSAYQPLVDAAFLADRIGARHVADQALRSLAVYCATHGRLEEAARLLGYADASFAATHIENAMWRRVDIRLAELLSGFDDLAAQRSEGAALKRAEVMSMLADMPSWFGGADPASPSVSPFA
jgi:hypothetical protein